MISETYSYNLDNTIDKRCLLRSLFHSTDRSFIIHRLLQASRKTHIFFPPSFKSAWRHNETHADFFTIHECIRTHKVKGAPRMSAQIYQERHTLTSHHLWMSPDTKQNKKTKKTKKREREREKKKKKREKKKRERHTDCLPFLRLKITRKTHWFSTTHECLRTPRKTHWFSTTQIPNTWKVQKNAIY